MKKQDLHIIYMGTPDFAVEPLRCLVNEGFQVAGVVTMPDKAIGRHQTSLQASPVKQYAQSAGLRVLQPVKLKDPAFLRELKALKADVQVVVAFRMLPEEVWAMPPLGTLNLHASLLPQYRGAAPINWAIINGETETGLTTFFLKHEIDTGDIIDRVRVPVREDDNAGTLHDRLMKLGGTFVTETLTKLLDGRLTTTPQQLSGEETLRPAPKIFKETCRIDWHSPLPKLYDFVRGLSPCPAAWTELQNGADRQTLKVYAAEKVTATHRLPIGQCVFTNGHFDVAVNGGFLRLINLQAAGKRRMEATDFLRGFVPKADCHVNPTARELYPPCERRPSSPDGGLF